MNALQTLKTIRDDIENSKHWLQGSFANPSALSNMSARFQSYAQQLKELEAERIQDLQENGPKLSGTLSDMTVTLLRDGKEKHVEFGEYTFKLNMTDNQEKIKSLKIDGSPDAEGMTHFIEASPGDWGQMPWGVWISKEESAKLNNEFGRFYEDEEDYYNQDHKCTFCGSMVSECGEDHGDEMRDRQREALRGYRY